MSLTTSGKNASSSTKSTARSPIIVRPARLTDGYRMGWIAAVTYNNTSLTDMLAPHRHQYFEHYVRGFQQRATARTFDARHMGYVAVEASNPSVVVGYAHFVRLGDDEGAKRQIASRNALLLWVLGWLFSVYCKVFGLFVGGDKSADLDAIKWFENVGKADEEKHFQSHPERVNRWHTQSCVVLKEFQGRGAGKLLMGQVVKRAEAEGVPVGLEASMEGERLYRSVGFKVLSRFSLVLSEADRDTGGFMLWSPSAWENK
ncbi:uncharacterized protein BP5553_02450 [Venustampulla echinocandica]|uniref:N-acetyltransferase domain-containing protein n=1 Tax=Venustampulla echinocandica TaxID=2656787 RepID=A0A370U3W6_9HELO|nr:uncharacterized protein BP5553_02450 [Venustampulla echinocandica]RDL42471.1 hypothetical protein BP5553_02450 [Venustampulla echinocandica]